MNRGAALSCPAAWPQANAFPSPGVSFHQKNEDHKLSPIGWRRTSGDAVEVPGAEVP